MAAVDDLIDFIVIESHKENIQALPSGRSAKALTQIYSPSLLGAQPSPVDIQDANAGPRKAFEQELQNIDEADDPLDVYDRYVKWTLDAYPSVQATPQSRLLPLLERATRAFQTSNHYKNDPRYLRLWLHYIRLFADAPREVFVFLARNDIGVGLALYYEEFAAWLENNGRWAQAEEVYQMGLEKEARPAERLLRKFGEFERRNQAREHDPSEPTSPVLPKVRPALAAKIDPFASSSPSTAAQTQQSSASTSKKTKSSKMAIFSDADEPPRPDSGSSSKGWDNIGTLAERKKENTVEARPWAGEKLKSGKTNGGMSKMMVFKDQSSRKSSLPRHLSRRTNRSSHTHQCVPNAKTGRMECVFVNLEAVYPNTGNSSDEYCFEELRAMHRGLLNKQWRAVDNFKGSVSSMSAPKPEEDREEDMHHHDEVSADKSQQLESSNPQHQPPATSRTKQRGFEIFDDALNPPAKETGVERDERIVVETFSQTLALNDENDENAPPAPPSSTTTANDDAALAKKVRREERANRTRKIQVMDVKHIKNETKTIQLNLDSPTGPKLKRKKSGEGKSEPTMTINTREAMDEIYGIFNQPLPSQTADTTDVEDEESEDDYTTDGESTGTGKLSGPPSEYGDETKNELLGAHKTVSRDDDGRTNVSEWSDFTTSKHVPKDADQSSALESTQNTSLDAYDDGRAEASHAGEDLLTPVDDEEPRTRYVPLPPEGYEPMTGQYRDPVVVANNRLPFMTPIVERTESSLGAATARTEKDYFGAKTPSRQAGASVSSPDDDLASSPFQEVTADLDEERRKVLQPVRTKSTKGTISLGQGSVKSQIAAKHQRPSSAEGPSGPIINDNQCNPMDPILRQTILSQVKPSLASFDGYHEHDEITSGRTTEIKKYIRALAKVNKSSSGLEKTVQPLSLPPTLSFQGTDGTYTIKRELGAGTFAPVYLVENSALSVADDACEDQDADQPPSRVGPSVHRKALEAIKMEEPPSTWEFYMIRQCHRRLGVARASESIVRAHEMHLFADECFLVEEYRDQGTLLDLINIARGDNAGGMEEMLAMWFAVELLRTVENLHAKQLIHGDLKGDNVLVRFDDPGAETDWSATYFPNGAHGWAAKGVCLIDLGRGIDMRAFGPNVAFIADWATTDADCAEMRELRPWTYQIDYHGLAGVLHSLLFGKYMETVGEKATATMPGVTGACRAPKTYRIRDPLKRYWQTDLWGDAFNLLLNPLAHAGEEDGGRMPLVKGMRGIRERMETWLEENCERGVGLKGMVGRMEAAVRDRRRTVRSGKAA